MALRDLAKLPRTVGDHCQVLWSEMRGHRGRPAGTDEEHLAAAMSWLARAQDAAGDGVAARYCLWRGWDKPYPETTGYIVPTCMRYAALTGDRDFLARARRMVEWELDQQLACGAIPGRTGKKAEPVVFDTGQAILGWVSWYRHAPDIRVAEAAARAGEWLLSVQEDDGAWRRFEFLSLAHAYNSRVAWALLALGRLLNEPRFAAAARRHIDWILGHQRDDGWIEHMGFDERNAPFTHTIAYTLEGLWECARYLDDADARPLRAAVEAAWHSLIDTFQRLEWFMPGRLLPGWREAARSACLTGNAQLAIIALRMATPLSRTEHLALARRLVDTVKRAQRLDISSPGLHGGVGGSAPVWGSYLTFQYPNWAAKFFADALMQCIVMERPCRDPELWLQAEG